VAVTDTQTNGRTRLHSVRPNWPGRIQGHGEWRCMSLTGFCKCSRQTNFLAYSDSGCSCANLHA